MHMYTSYYINRLDLQTIIPYVLELLFAMQQEQIHVYWLDAWKGNKGKWASWGYGGGSKFDYPPRGTVLDALDCKQQK